jgi:hypothetical protein
MLQKFNDACFVKFDVIKKHDRLQTMLHAFLIPPKGAGEWPASRLGRFTSEENATEIFVGSMAKDKFLLMLGIEPRPSSP